MKYSRRTFIKLLGGTTAYLGLTGHNAFASRPTLQYSSAPPLQTPIQEIYPTVFENEIYVTGGFVPSNKPAFFGLAPTNKVYIFSPHTQTWRLGKDLPEARHHLGLLSNSKYLYGIGGFKGEKGNAWQTQDTVLRKESGDAPWQIGPSLPAPVAECIYASCSEDLHVIGGVTKDKLTNKGSYSDKHYVLVDNDHWETAAPPNIVRSSAAGTTLNNMIYTFGGRQAGKQAKNLTFAEVYDKTTDNWQSIAPLPYAVAGLTAASIGNKILVTGGEAFGANSNWKTGKAHKDVWLYDPSSDKWERGPELPKARHGHGAVSYKGGVYLIGGAHKVGPQDTTSSIVLVHR